MFGNKDKAVLVFEISGVQRENTCQNILKLLEILISEIRIENDDVEVNSMLRNQGKIAAYLTLQEYIIRGFPTPNRVV